ncbi:MAG: KilA-N domain-containing protein [Bacteroidia bacterium]|nr:KilA-N domain-containing protein [Bacteroidia bacterium]
MKREKKRSILVNGNKVEILSIEKADFISLSDMANGFAGGVSLIEQWIRNKDSIEFLGLWEQINNPNFNSLEFGGTRSEAGTNRFYPSGK